jgi:Na+-driven multidrug efflux pump
MRWFSREPGVLAAGARYLAIVGPVYGLTAINMELYFAGQAAGRIGWPLAATLFRFGCAATATALAMRGALGLDAVYGIVAFGTLGACVMTLLGFRRVQWGARATSSSR